MEILHQYFHAPHVYLLYGMDTMDGKIWREPSDRRTTSEDYPCYWEHMRFPQGSAEPGLVLHVGIEGTCGPLYWRDDLSGPGGVLITLIVPPGLAIAAKQILLSDTIMRVGGNTTNETVGTGTTNPFFNMVSNIVVSSWLGAKAGSQYAWALCDSRVQGLVFQRVSPFNIMEENQGMTSESYITRDVIRYKAMGYFGTGMVDDRAWFYSNSSTAPTVS